MPKPKSNEKAHRKTARKRKSATSSSLQTQGQAKKKAPQIPKKKSREKILSPKPKLYISDVPKYYDIGNVPKGSKLTRYWNYEEIIPYFKDFRKGALDLPKTYRYWDHNFLLKTYNLKGIEFGNWLSQEDRLNYICATGIALYDLKKLLGFSNTDIGLKGKLSLTFGSRGIPKALAHFTPAHWLINISRYKDYGNAGEFLRLPVPQNRKLQSFLKTGGVGALGHEYGHALDYWVGGYFDQSRQHYALSRGRSVSREVDRSHLNKKTPRGLMEKLLMNIIWEDYEKKILSPYYHTLYNYTTGDYWIRRNELFARSFEQWISFEMNRKKQINSFLHFNKYGGVPYLDEKLMKKVAPIFAELMAAIRKIIK